MTARAQTPLSNLVFAVGTTIRDPANQEWSYVLLSSVDDAVLTGRRFAVFGKPGQAGSPNPFTQRGTMLRPTDPGVINTLLNQSVALGEDQLSLSNALNLMFRSVPGITNQLLAQKILTVFQLAATDPEVAELLRLIGNGHPGFNLCLGRAFSESVNSVTTYEVRELDPVSGTPGDVVGRVTVTPGVPVVLPAPNRPFQAVTNEPSDHLRIRLRWGTPPDLRRLSPLQYGYNVWRMPRLAAEAASFHLTPPTLAQLANNPDVARANAAPVVTPVELEPGSGLGGAEFAADRLTYFFADTGRATGITFTDGQEFYYFVTARDILGRDGLVSPGGLARACRRLAPKPATDLRVENAVLPGSTNLPRLQVFWKQNTNTTDAVTDYWVYRWINPTAALTNDAAPLSNRIAVVPHVAGTNFNSYLDTSTGALTNANLSNVWYTVRAVSVAACDPLLAPHTPPAWGVLRQRDGPVATTGELIGSCGTPVVMFLNFATNTISTNAQNWSLRLTCVRRDPGIAWVTFTITNSVSGTRTIGPVYFPPDEDVAPVDFEIPAADSFYPQVRVTCAVGTFYNQTSPPAVSTFTVPVPAGQQKEVVFYAGQLLGTALSSGDPLLTVLNGGVSQCLPGNAVTPDASGMVSMTFDYNDAPTVLVQALSNNVWLDVAVVTPTTNRIYWVSYPACLIGPVPPFRGCRVNFPPGGGDCEQHVSVAAAGGAIAPIRVRFRLTPRTREYRVYRRVDDGPLTLFAQGAAVYDPANTNKLIESKDDAMPPSSARLCYFVQLLDEHGNGSPLAFIGCKEVKPAKLPRPVLSEPLAIGTVGSPQVMLNWFCPPAGVARFQFKLRLVDAPAPAAPSGFASPLTTVYTGYNTASSYLGLSKIQAILAVAFSEAHLTARIGPGFGPGPQFALTANVLPNTTYAISVAAVDDQGNVGNASEVWEFKWTPPLPVVTVPWPARTLPPVRDFDTLTTAPPGYEFHPRVAAVVLTNVAGGLLDRRYPVLIRIGEILDNNEGSGNVGTTNFVDNYDTVGVNPDPNKAVFRSLSSDASRANQPLLPIVIYRQQVTNAYFPKVSGDLTQVSPLIERIPWRNDNGYITVPDRLFASHYESKDNQNYYFFLYVRDQQPVLAGAAYQYFVLRFNAQHEPQEIVPTAAVRIPLN